MKVTGACHCGAITIEGEADPEKVNICHCTDCQTGTGSAFRVSVPIPGAQFKMKGTPTNYVKTTSESGNPRVQAFCGQVRLADLFDLAGRRPAGVLHGAGRHPEGARPARAEAAELVPLGAELGDAHGCDSEEPRSSGRERPSPALMAAIDILHWIESGHRRHNGGSAIRRPP